MKLSEIMNGASYSNGLFVKTIPVEPEFNFYEPLKRMPNGWLCIDSDGDLLLMGEDEEVRVYTPSVGELTEYQAVLANFD